MSDIQNFEDVTKVLAGYVPPLRKFRTHYTLDNMRALMAYLGNPQDSYRVIHVAGTSGKTSTAYFVASLLRQTGKKVGLTVSPHVDKVSERVQIDLKPLDDVLYFEELSTFIKIVDASGVKPTYFELLVAFAYWEFARYKVDYGVVEVGLGGLLDGTNVITRSDKVSVITDIGLDHVDILGSNISEIARQKAGIILPESHAFHLTQTPEINEVFEQVAKAQHAQLHNFSCKVDPLTNNLPLFQQRNWFLAHQVAEFVIKRDKLANLTDAQLAASTRIHIPARMEIIEKKGHTLVLDAAHNPQKMQALVPSLKARFPGQKFAVLLSLLQSKDMRLNGVLAELLPITSHLIVTDFVAGQDLRKHSTDPEKIVDACHDLGFDSVEIILNTKQAYETLVKRLEPLCLVTGSFYLLHDMHHLIGKL